MEITYSEFICDRCSKELGGGAEVVSKTPICRRCTGKCRIQQVGKKKEPKTLESIIDRVLGQTAAQMRMFPQQSSYLAALLATTGIQEARPCPADK